MDRYTYMVVWSSEDEAFVAYVLEFKSLAAHGDTANEALAELRSVVKTVVEELQEDGEPVPEALSERPYSGKFVLRMPISMHRQLAIEAAYEGVSLNQLINLKLTQQS